MMDWILENAAIALLLAGVVWLLTRAVRFRPAVEHALWLVVLIRLVMPPVVDWPWSFSRASRPVPADEAGDARKALPPATPAPSPSEAPREESEPRRLVSLSQRNEPAAPLAAGTDGDRSRPEPSRSEFERRELFTPPPRNEPATRVASAPGGDHGPEGVRLAVAETPARAGDRGESSPRRDAAGATPGNTLATSSAPREARDVAPAGIAPAWTGEAATDEPTAPPSAFSTALPSLREAAAGAWLAGACLVLLLHLLRVLRFRRFLRGSRPPPAWLAREARALAASMGVGPPRVLVVPGRRSPAVWSLGRPALLVPRALLEHLERCAWRGVLLHELAHLRRRDHWVGWLLLATGALHWWNPVLYLVRRRLRASAELACDAWVVEALPRERRAYAESLIDISAFASPAPEPAPTIGVASGTRKTYERRLRMILESHDGARLPLGALIAAALLTLVALPGWSQSEPESAAEKPAGDDVAVEEAPGSAGGLDEPLIEGEDEADAPDLLDAPAESGDTDPLEDAGEDGRALDDRSTEPEDEAGSDDELVEERRSPLRRFLDEHHIPVQEIERTLRDTLEDTQKHIGRLEERLDALLDDPGVKKVERKLEEGLEETRKQLDRLRAKLEDALDHPRVRELEREGREVLRDVLEELKGSLEDVIEELEPGERSRPGPRAEGRAFDRQREDAWRQWEREGTDDRPGLDDGWNLRRRRREAKDTLAPHDPHRDAPWLRREGDHFPGPPDDPFALPDTVVSPPQPRRPPKELTPVAEQILKIYKLPHEKAKVLADFLREHARRERQVAVHGDQLIVAGPARLHRHIETLVELIAPKGRSSQPHFREGEPAAPDLKSRR